MHLTATYIITPPPLNVNCSGTKRSGDQLDIACGIDRVHHDALVVRGVDQALDPEFEDCPRDVSVQVPDQVKSLLIDLIGGCINHALSS